MDAARRVADQIKRNGEFDKCRKEVLAKVLQSDSVKRSSDQCHRLVKDVLRNSRPNANISMLREIVKDEIRRRSLINPLLSRAEQEFHEYENLSKLHEMIEEMTRSELGLPPLDTNIELVDMDVSSGATSTTSGSTPSASTGRSTPAEHGPKLVNGYTVMKRDVTESPPPPPPPIRDSVSPPPPPPLLKCSQTPQFEGRSNITRIRNCDRKEKKSTSKPKRYSSESDSDRSVKLSEKKMKTIDPSPLSTANSTPHYEYVSRSPSVISDDSLPPYPSISFVPTTLLTDQGNELKSTQRPPPPSALQHGEASQKIYKTAPWLEMCKVEAISESEESEQESTSVKIAGT